MRITFKSFDELLPLTKLKKSKHQRNKHPEDQIERLAKIMDKHGVRQPIHISKQSGEVCFGHGRWEAAKLNGYKKYPVVYQDFKSDEEEYACVQSDNAIAGWSELDILTINADLAELGPGFDVTLLGLKDFLLDISNENFEANKEWAGMPEFTQEDKTAYKSVALHFHSQEAVDIFAKLIKQTITEDTRTIWYPTMIIEKAADKRYGAQA